VFPSVVQVETLYMLGEGSSELEALRRDCSVSVLLLLVLPFAHHVCVLLQSSAAKNVEERKVML
jgi:hypothetical protein